MYVIGCWIFIQFFSLNNNEESNIAYLAHIGGFIAGIILIIMFKKNISNKSKKFIGYFLHGIKLKSYKFVKYKTKKNKKEQTINKMNLKYNNNILYIWYFIIVHVVILKQIIVQITKGI